MDAAQALFLERGFAATSVDEIVKAADVAKGTFYLHFKSKDEMLQALQARFVATFCEDIRDALETCAPQDWHGRLDVWIEATVRGYLDRVMLHDLVFHESRSVHRHMKHDTPVILQLSALLENGAEKGAWAVKNAPLTAVMLFHALHGAVDDAIDDAREADRETLVATVKPFCRQALGLKP